MDGTFPNLDAAKAVAKPGFAPIIPNLVFPSSLYGKPIPMMEWIVDGWNPDRRCNACLWRRRCWQDVARSAPHGLYGTRQNPGARCQSITASPLASSAKMMTTSCTVGNTTSSAT